MQVAFNNPLNPSMEKTTFTLHKNDDSIPLPEIISIIPVKEDIVFPRLVRIIELYGKGLVTAINEAHAKNECIGIVVLKYHVASPRPEDFYD
ncbi:MAG: hypothetical protein NUV76_12600, partial [Candidatus Kuenenia sp.]|nr:hypothetical protein [Candidatus Kuenenia sp.]